MTTRSRLDALAILVATLCGAGRFPFAPGTAGTLAALPLAALAAHLLTTWGFAAATAALALAGIWAAGRAAPILGQKDPGAIVIDEAAGLCVSLLGIPLGWRTLCGAFAETAAKLAGRDALRWGAHGKAMSWREYHESVGNFALVLRALRFPRGSFVALLTRTLWVALAGFVLTAMAAARWMWPAEPEKAP